MNRTFTFLSGLSFLAIIIMTVLIAFGVVNLINWVKYLVLFCSTFLTIFSIGIFILRSDLSKIFTILIIFFLILPWFAPLLGLFKAEYITNYWKLFIGGSIFQIGTGIFVILGGFIRKDRVGLYQVLNSINYAIFLLLAIVLILNLTRLISHNLLLTLGGVLSIMSLFLVFFKREVR